MGPLPNNGTRSRTATIEATATGMKLRGRHSKRSNSTARRVAAIGADHCEKSNAAVRSPICARAPGNGCKPKRRVMNLMIEVVSYCV